jgi:Outer membrane protein beta-barrel domain
MKKCYRLLLAAALMSFISPAIAEELSYTYASVKYAKFSSKIDGVSDTLDGSGYNVDLSYALRPHIALMAGYSTGTADVESAGTRVDVDIDATMLGLLIHVAINDTSDFIVGAGFINGKAVVTVDGSSKNTVDADGGITIIGFRAMVFEKLEINGFVRKNSIEDNSTISVSFAAGYYIKKSVSLDLGYLIDSEDGSDLITFGVTKYF